MDADSDIGRLLVSRNLPLTSERYLVFGTRSLAHTILELLPPGPIVLDCWHVSVISPPFFHELLRDRPDLTFEGMNEDIEASLELAKEHIAKEGKE